MGTMNMNYKLAKEFEQYKRDHKEAIVGMAVLKYLIDKNIEDVNIPYFMNKDLYIEATEKLQSIKMQGMIDEYYEPAYNMMSKYLD